MEVIHSPSEARRLTFSLREQGASVGLVPTMGALHEGHLSLVRKSNQTCGSTIASIFVNPTQFGPHEDLEKYPRSFDQDCELLAAEGVRAVFAPESDSIYPDGFSTYVEPPEVAKPWEGVCRPGHFRGVATIVMKLFQCVPATHALFGKKDYQQWKVIEAMARDLNVGIKIIAGETIREPDGLALSSRNRYLDEDDRRRALLLSESLDAVSRSAASGNRNIETLESAMRRTLIGADAASVDTVAVDKIDYAVVVDAETLSPLATLDRPAVALIAASIGGTRLIDNRELAAR